MFQFWTSRCKARSNLELIRLLPSNTGNTHLDAGQHLCLLLQDLIIHIGGSHESPKATPGLSWTTLGGSMVFSSSGKVHKTNGALADGWNDQGCISCPQGCWGTAISSGNWKGNSIWWGSSLRFFFHIVPVHRTWGYGLVTKADVVNPAPPPRFLFWGLCCCHCFPVMKLWDFASGST